VDDEESSLADMFSAATPSEGPVQVTDLTADAVSLGSQDTEPKRANKPKSAVRQGTKFTFTFQLSESRTWDKLTKALANLVEAKTFTYFVCGYEIAPNTGKKHGQGYGELPPTKKTTITGCAKKFGNWKPHIELAVAGPEQNRNYCLGLSTGKTPNAIYFELGKPRSYTTEGPGKRQKMDWDAQLAQAKVDFLQCSPRLVITCYNNLQKINYASGGSNQTILGHNNYWLHGKPGVGKTRLAFAMAEALGCASPYIKCSQNKWWDNYNNEAVVLIDEFEQDAKYQGHLLKVAGDVRAFKAEMKGSSKQIRPSTIIVTSNYRIEDIWTDTEMRTALHRRYKVVHVQNFEQALGMWQSATHDTPSDPPGEYVQPTVPGFQM